MFERTLFSISDLINNLRLPTKNALVAPLDWGLGHATRCIPVIHTLSQAGYKVIIMAEGTQAFLLQQEFPDLTILPLRGYRITYSNNKRFLPLKILGQIPKILSTIYYEHRSLKQVVKENNISLIISDNRFGLWHNKIHSIYITHQLNIQAPFKWLQKSIRAINYFFINRYDACWVPDYESNNNIAGDLSHPVKLPNVPVHYIGPLSRLKKVCAEKKYQWLIVLSGPEPQRTILENKLLQILPSLNGQILFVRAKPGSADTIKDVANCTFKNHLPTNEMEMAFAQSEYVITRSGYTTVMELLALNKKAILIPTPGQTEQEYLAKHLMKQGWCYTCEQGDDILSALKNKNTFFKIRQDNTY